MKRAAWALLCAAILMYSGCDKTKLDGLKLPKAPAGAVPGILSGKNPPAEEAASAAPLPRPIKGPRLPKAVVREGDEFMNAWDRAFLVSIPEGYYPMGADGGERREQPAHEVYLDAFYIYRCEVTRGQFAKYLNRTKREYGGKALKQAGTTWVPEPGTEAAPATDLSWREAKVYAEWAGGRLPTESQWEAAARAVGSGPFPWGDDPPGPSRINALGTGPGKLLCVAGLPAGVSPFGCLDMSGNAAEWCLDAFAEDAYSRRGSLAKNPLDERFGFGRIVRGGGYLSPPVACRVTSRAGLDEDTRLPWVGFRIVIPAEEMIEFPVSKDAAPGTRTETPPPDKQERP